MRRSSIPFSSGRCPPCWNAMVRTGCHATRSAVSDHGEKAEPLPAGATASYQDHLIARALIPLSLLTEATVTRDWRLGMPRSACHGGERMGSSGVLPAALY